MAKATLPGEMLIILGQFLQLVSLRAVILRLFGSDAASGALECVLPEVLIGEKSTYCMLKPFQLHQPTRTRRFFLPAIPLFPRFAPDARFPRAGLLVFLPPMKTFTARPAWPSPEITAHACL